MSTLTPGQTVEPCPGDGNLCQTEDGVSCLVCPKVLTCAGCGRPMHAPTWGCVRPRPSDAPSLPYPGPGGPNSGFSSDSGEAAVRAMDADGRTSEQQRLALDQLARRRVLGATWRDLAVTLDWHHGTASRTLTDLHKAGRIARLAETRVRCKVYVLPEYVNDRETEEQGRGRLSEGTISYLLHCLDAMQAVGEIDDAEFERARRKVERL